MTFRSRFTKIPKSLIVALIALFALSIGAMGGSLTPSAVVGSTMHSLANIWDVIASSTYDSSAVTANQNGSLLANLKYIENQMTWASSSGNIWNLNSGNVGIGTSSPANPLMVVASNSNTTFGGSAGQYVTSFRNTSAVTNSYALLSFDWNVANNAPSVLIGAQFTTPASNYGDFVIGTRGAGGFGERLRVTSGGNIGINDATPTTTLDINGSASVSGTFETTGLRINGSITQAGSQGLGSNNLITSIISSGKKERYAGNDGLGQSRPAYYNIDQSAAIPGTRDSATQFTRTSGTWTADALVGQYAFSYAAASPNTGVWLPITANTTTTITVSGVLTASADTIKTSPWNPIANTYVHGQAAQPFFGGVFDGESVWLAPYGSSNLVKVNPATGAMTTYAHGQGGSAFNGAVFDGESIWLVPRISSNLVKVNPATGAMTTYAHGQAGAFIGGVFDGESIWLVPYTSSNLVKVNPATGAMTTYAHGQGATAFMGGVFDGESIWLIPFTSSNLVKVNPSTGAMTTYAHGQGTSAFVGGVFDGESIWLVPYNSANLVKVNPATGAMTTYAHGQGTSAFAGGIFDGESIWLSPNTSANLIKVNPATGAMTTYAHGQGVGAFMGTVFDGESIWLIPWNSANLVRMRPPRFGRESIFTAGKLNIGGAASISGNFAINTDKFFVNALGNVGIGTTTPSTRLSVIGSRGNYDIFDVASSSGTSLLRITKSGNVGVGTTTPDAQFHVAGLTPVKVGQVATDTDTSSRGGLYVQGNYLYTVNNTATTFQIFDASVPSAPVLISTTTVRAPLLPHAVYVQGRYAYIIGSRNGGSNPFQVYDITNPTAPVFMGEINQLDNFSTIWVQGRYAYSQRGSHMSTFDIANPTRPVQVSQMTAGGINLQQVFVHGKYAYNSITGGLSIYDISNPTSMSKVFNANSAAFGPTTVHGKYAYSANDTVFRVRDISNPASPSAVGLLTIPSGTVYRMPAVQGNYVYLVGGSPLNALYVIDVTVPSAPVLVSTTTLASDPSHPQINGRYLYVKSLGTNVIEIFDIGGAYVQQLEAGSVVGSNLLVRNNISILNDANIAGGLAIGRSLQVMGEFSVYASSTNRLQSLGLDSRGLTLSSYPLESTFRIVASGGNGFDNLLFRNNLNTNLVTIASSGNVGIGTGATNPQATLELIGTASLSNSIYTSNNGFTRIGASAKDSIRSLDIYGSAWVNSTGADLRVINSGTIAAGITLISSSSASNLTKYSLIATGTGAAIGSGSFQIVNNSNTTFPFNISRAGNIGIGSQNYTDLSSILNIKLSSTTGNPFVIRNNSLLTLASISVDTPGLSGHTSLGLFNNGALRVRFATNPASASFISAGNVGIGATTPEQKFEVGGNILASSSATALLQLRANNEDDATFSLQVTGTAGSAARFDILGSASQAFMTIASSGNVGIGSTAPTSTLYVEKFSGSTVEPGIQKVMSLSNVSIAVGSGPALDFLWGNGTPRTNGARIYTSMITTNQATLRFAINDGLGNFIDRLTIAPVAGNVGIGTTAPTATLHIVGSASYTPFIIASSSGGSLFTILKSGNIGINDSTPTTTLDISGSASVSSAFEVGTNAFIVKPTGNVGIGTNDLTERLEVVGNASISGNLTIGGNCSDAPGGGGCTADYAEVYQRDPSDPMAATDLLSLDPVTGRVTRASLRKDSIVGVFTSTPGTLIGQRSSSIQLGIGSKVMESLDADEIPVALVGRVPLRVSLENGPIDIGDRLSVSSVPGVAARAKYAGMTVGVAMEPLTELASGSFGVVTVYVNVSYWEPSIRDEITQLASAGPEVVVSSEGFPMLSELFSAIVDMFDRVMGIVFERGGRIKAKELCLDEVCVTKDRLLQLLEFQGIAPIITPTPTPISTPGVSESPTPTPDPLVSESPTPTPDSVVTTESPTPSPVVSEVPTPTPTPEPIPVVSDTPVPEPTPEG